MGPLKDIRLSWSAFSLLTLVSLAATVFILAGAGSRSPAASAALAALRDQPKTIAAAKAAPATNGGGSTGASSGTGGGGSQGGSGGGTSSSSGSDTTTTSSTEPTTSTATTSTTTKKHDTPPPDAGLPKVKHVFEIALSTPSYAAAFGKQTEATYLQSLVSKGALLTNFESFGHSSELADYLAEVSGQAPNSDTAGGCPVYKSFPSSAAANAKGIVSGNGCIYPDTALTLADQTGISGETWGAYMQSMGASSSCEYPDPGASESKGIVGTEPGYSLEHNPFIYFESLLEEGSCDSSDLDLSLLPKALSKARTTPNFVYVAPNACGDGDPVMAAAGAGGTGDAGTTTNATGSADTTGSGGATTTATTTTATTTTGSASTTAPAVGCPAGDPSGIAAEDAFLQTWVPKILASPAYKQDGVLVITFAASGDKAAGKMVRTGTLVISKHTKHGLKVGGGYGPYSLLRSVEDMLDYKPLAHAAGAASFAKKVLAK